MPLVHDDHVVQTFSTNTSDNPFRIAVLPRTPSRYRNLLDTQSIDSCREIMTIDPITISYQVARRCFLRKRFDDLLRRPSSSRVFRHIEMQNTPTVMREDDEDIQHTELYGRNRKEVDRDHLTDVISKKRHPGLRRPSCLLGHQRDTVRSEILNPSFFSSPCTRGAPHVGLAVAIVWTSLRISEHVRGLP